MAEKRDECKKILKSPRFTRCETFTPHPRHLILKITETANPKPNSPNQSPNNPSGAAAERAKEGETVDLGRKVAQALRLGL